MYYTLLWQVLCFAVPFTNLSKLCKNAGPKPFCWAKLACFGLYPIVISMVTYWALLELLLQTNTICQGNSMYNLQHFHAAETERDKKLCGRGIHTIANMVELRDILSLIPMGLSVHRMSQISVGWGNPCCSLSLKGRQWFHLQKLLHSRLLQCWNKTSSFDL
jgi:hypothetical protein